MLIKIGRPIMKSLSQKIKKKKLISKK